MAEIKLPASWAPRIKRILIAEDEAMIAYDLGSIVIGMGYEVIEPAPSVSKAMHAIVSDPPDAAILNIELRKETSFPIAEALAERGIPFLFLTGHRRNELPPAFRTYAFLSKPITIAQLKSALESLLPQRHLHLVRQEECRPETLASKTTDSCE